MLLTTINKIKKLFFNPLASEIHINRLLMGRLLSDQIKSKGIVDDIREVEFKVFSQWGDDGIIQYLVHHIDIPDKTFIEFGVENYTEANTRFLLINDNWSGMIMDGSRQHMEYVKRDPVSWRHDLVAKDVFVTAENINDLIRSSGFSREVGILHIDIDGNDYWIWKKIDCIEPVIVIMEYNSVFGADRPITTPYIPDFYRTRYHHSNLLYGSSLLSLCDLAESKGYYFIGCNSAGNNAYFVRKDKIGNIKTKTPQEGYVESKFKEGRNSLGGLTYLGGRKRLDAIKGGEVYNTRTNQPEKI